MNTLDGATDCRGAPPFSSFDDPLRWGGCTPSVDVLRKIFLDDHKGRRAWLDKRVMLIDPGPILKGDASHKASKLIFSEGRNVAGSTYTLMNGRNEVLIYIVKLKFPFHLLPLSARTPPVVDNSNCNNIDNSSTSDNKKGSKSRTWHCTNTDEKLPKDTKYIKGQCTRQCTVCKLFLESLSSQSNSVAKKKKV